MKTATLFGLGLALLVGNAAAILDEEGSPMPPGNHLECDEKDAYGCGFDGSSVWKCDGKQYKQETICKVDDHNGCCFIGWQDPDPSKNVDWPYACRMGC